MADSDPDQLARLLQASRQGDARAGRDLLPLLYKELRTLAGSLLRRKPPGQTLQATALVHEAYLRLAGSEDPGWDGRGHFFGAAARAMRDILVEEARRKATLKRGGDRQRVELEEHVLAVDPPCENLLALDEALERLEEDDPEKAKIVLLRYFAGLSVAETAEVLGVSKTKVEREWRYIRAWLYKEIDEALAE